MRILAFTTLFPNPAQRLLGTFVRARLAALGRATPLTVIAPVAGPGWFGRGISVRKVPLEERQGDLTVHHPRFFNFPGVLKRLDARLLAASVRTCFQKVVEEFQPDLVDAHWGYPDGAAAALLAKEAGLPYFVTVRGDDVTVFLDTPARRGQILASLRGATRVIGVSRNLLDEAVKAGVPEGLCRRAPNGVDTGLFHPEGRETSRSSFGIADDTPLLLWLGRFSDEKGLDLMIRSLEQLRSERGRRARLVLLGPGHDRGLARSLKRLAAGLRLKDRVWFKAPVSDPGELRRWYSAADMFLMASSREGWPNVLLEALACGCPVVAPAVGGIPEVLENAKCGILVERSAADLARGIDTALHRDWDKKAIVRYARARSWDKTAEICLEIYANALGRGVRGRT